MRQNLHRPQITRLREVALLPHDMAPHLVVNSVPLAVSVSIQIVETFKDVLIEAAEKFFSIELKESGYGTD